MAQYRAIVEHVRHWRGGIHRWSTSYLMTGSLTAPLDATACQTLMLADNKMLYQKSSGVDGSAYKCSIYAASGGVPIASYTAFDWETPASWTPVVGSVWTAAATACDAVAETACLVEWPAGLSSTGKPVKFRKWYHQVPPSAAAGGAVDILSAQVTALNTQANAISVCLYSGYGIALGTAGRLPGTPVTSPFYGNHQMPRGRRKKTTTSTAKQASDFEQVLQLIESQGYKQANGD
jgi:hypothetical protein